MIPKKVLGLLLRLSLVVLCLLYAFWKVDLGRLGIVFGNFNPVFLVAAQVYLLGVLSLPALRINFLSQKKAGFLHSFKTVMLGLGMNNILPARLGELAKGVYLKREVGIPISRGLNIVFWERFSDLHSIFLLATIHAAFFIRDVRIALTLLGPMAGIWCLLILNKRWPDASIRFLKVIKPKFLTSFITEFLKQVQTHFHLRFLLSLFVYALFVWVFFVSVPYLVLWGIAGLDLDFGQILTVVLISSLGMALPSSPGAIGVYEASIVAPLTHFGIDKEEALAAAIVLHMIQYIPSTLGALLIMMRTGLGIKSFRLREAA
ncbi:MAG: flippase-like domain-containing protein [Deltaproteobacteria bacterium]|nr:flippase-like domain-containing protein [Deltaproteobacteria bacterium]